MKNGTQKKTNAVRSAAERPELHTQIEMRAYELWQTNGCCNGNDLAHWLQAESELVDLNPGSSRSAVRAI